MPRPFLPVLLAAVLGLTTAWAQAEETIEQVLLRSQAQRLADRGPALNPSPESVQNLRTSFERLKALAPELADVELQLVGGDLYAESLFGRRVVAASTAVGELPERERLLMLAHELGHQALGHWEALAGLYHQHVPAAVRRELTDPVAGVLGHEGSALSWRHEFEADAWGYRLARPLELGVEDAVGLLLRQGVLGDSPTHPGTRRRLLQLRMLENEIAGLPVPEQFRLMQVSWRGDGAASGR
ncbi:hypothetical protein KAK06_06195 [Ideonella sp. 4Y11]|uniref:Peptidase M48 domain-containing protein n=1 Tax=Ideonella aquatica TaxID=2824119 RepID=A0A940YLJ8_9BURK|nr:M48 family metalloprotease [Ideonella aquatica]MBQ0958546.1 hypothetical protein [Ideonella aquatica]